MKKEARPPDEREWMLRTQAGDVGAFQLLYERFKGPLLSYVRSFIPNSDQTEDLTQEIFMKAFRSKDSYEPSAKVSTWLWTIARNTAIDHLRKHSNHELAVGAGGPVDDDSPVLNLEQLESPLPGAEAALIEGAREQSVQGCLATLAPNQREVLLLRTVSDLSYDEIATTTGLTLSAVKSLIFRAKSALTECISRKAGG